MATTSPKWGGIATKLLERASVYICSRCSEWRPIQSDPDSELEPITVSIQASSPECFEPIRRTDIICRDCAKAVFGSFWEQRLYTSDDLERKER